MNMNLYKLHTNPQGLHFHDEAYEKIPALFWEKYKDNPAELKKREYQLAKSAEYSYYYAHLVLKTPFPKGEDAIAKDAHWSYMYASRVLKGAFPKGEVVMYNHPIYWREYPTRVLRLPYDEAERWKP